MRVLKPVLVADKPLPKVTRKWRGCKYITQIKPIIARGGLTIPLHICGRGLDTFIHASQIFFFKAAISAPTYELPDHTDAITKKGEINMESEHKPAETLYLIDGTRPDFSRLLRHPRRTA